MDYKRKMMLMQDLQEIKDRSAKEYLTARVNKGVSGNIASSRLRDVKKKGAEISE